MSGRGSWHATQIERQRNEHTRLVQKETEGLFVNNVQQRTSALRSGGGRHRLCGGGGKEGAEGGRGSLPVMVVVGEKVREERAIRPNRYST